MMRAPPAICYLLSALCLTAAIIPADRRTDWSAAGVRGGIPTYTTVWTNLAPGVTLSALNGWLASCPSGQVVQLAAGNYSFAGTIDFDRATGVVLRGAGRTSTIINFTGDVTANIMLGNESDGRITPPASQVKNWTAGFAKGTTTITLSNVTGLPAIGHMLVLDQLDIYPLITSLHGTVTNGTQEGCSYCGRTSRDDGAEDWTDRSQQQYVIITSSNGNDIGISPGLHMGNWNLNRVPQVFWWSPADTAMCGVEDMTITNNTHNQFAIWIQEARDCWVKNVRSYKNPMDFVRPIQCAHIEVRGCDLLGAVSGSSGSYGITWFMTSDCLAIDNSSWGQSATLANGPAACGNVFAFNYITNSSYDDINTTWDIAGISDHDGGVCLNLTEGNWANKHYIDSIHGSQQMGTEFRNFYHGKQADPRDKNTICYAAQGYCFSNNIVGNVLGTSNYHDVWGCTNKANYDAGLGDKAIFVIGCSNANADLWDDRVLATTYWHGNYDTVSASQTWDSGNADHTLPDSLFLAAKPSWWGICPWPPYDPVTRNTSPTNIPAGYRFIFGTNPPAGPEGNGTVRRLRVIGSATAKRIIGL